MRPQDGSADTLMVSPAVFFVLKYLNERIFTMKNRIVPYESKSTSVTPINVQNSGGSLAQRTYAAAELDAFRDQLRAALAKQAMDNTAVLSLAEEHFIRLAPTGKAEYRLIVETYARKALAEIVGGDW
ncbi:hypothetical protein [Candidatus Nanosyncoccus alces]|nr:hypothetical protein [Candidatus Nanosyncoccus alces]